MIAVAIDGPAGAGKSTLARVAAKKLSFIYADTGALYRSIALNTVRNNIDVSDSVSIEKMLEKTEIELKFINDEQRVFLNGEDVSDKIRTSEISMAASSISALPAVRNFLLELQRELARKNNVIMDGRDIGTVVLPNAQVKIFLTASPECRAKRRYDEYIAKGKQENYEEILESIKQRDYNDSHRAIAPLKAADDAVLVDTSDDTPQQSVERIVKIIEEKTL
ncbi:MAG: (d)CMP kinase [Clostridia bacterium]|nr:(d)CMP kinase [Clostridia bacterium]